MLFSAVRAHRLHLAKTWHGKKKKLFGTKNSRWGGNVIKTQFSGIFFWLLKNPKLENMLFVCGHTGNIHCLFPVDKTKMLLSIDQSRKPFLFSLSHSSVLNFTPGCAFPLGIADLAATRHMLLFAVWIFLPHMRHLSRGSP